MYSLFFMILRNFVKIWNFDIYYGKEFFESGIFFQLKNCPVYVTKKKILPTLNYEIKLKMSNALYKYLAQKGSKSFKIVSCLVDT